MIDESMVNKIIEGLSQMDRSLVLVEVKGESVQALFATRLILKELYSSLMEEVEKDAKETAEKKKEV